MEKAIWDCLNHKNVPNFLFHTFLYSSYVYLLGNIYIYIMFYSVNILTHKDISWNAFNQPFLLGIRDSGMEKAVWDCLNHINVPNFLFDTFLYSLYVYLLGNIFFMVLI